MRSGSVTPASSIPPIHMSNVPQIFIDDASSLDSSDLSGSQSQLYTTSGNESSERLLENDHPNPDQNQDNDDAGSTSGASYNVGSNLVFGDFNPFSDSVLRQRSGRRTPPPGADYVSSNISPSQTPLMSPSSSPRLHAQSSTWYSGSTQLSYYRRSSEVPPQIMLDSLETPEWVGQIRDFIEGQEYSSSLAESTSGTGTGGSTGGGDGRLSGGSTTGASASNAGPS